MHRRYADPLTDPDLIARLAEDPAARRELIWLDAAARGDSGRMGDIQAVDPAVTARLTPYITRYLGASPSPPDAAQLYDQVWLERFCHLAAASNAERCRCKVCRA